MPETSFAATHARVAADHGAGVPRRAWVSMLARAVPALIAAAVITFSPDHSPWMGLTVFGGASLLGGILVAFEAIGIQRHPTRGLTFARGVLTAAAGAIALVLAAVHGLAAPASALILLVAAWALVTGVIELIAGWRARRLGPLGRDAFATGALTLLLGLLVAIVPPDLRIEYGGVEQVEGALTASTQAVGLIGAYFALLGVLLIIEGLTLRIGDQRAGAAVGADKDVAS